MKGMTLGIAILAGAAAFALDNTIDNAFWNTTGYVNAAPVTAVTAGVPGPLDTAVPAQVVSAPVADFNSRNPGATIIIR